MMDLLDGIWNGVTVGISTEQDVLSAFGSPSEIYHEDSTALKTTTYSYFDESDTQTGLIWITLKGDVVDVINLDSEAIQSKGGPRLMVDLVNLLGRPDIVSWSSLQGSRTLIWPTKGIAATVGFWAVEVDSSENHIWILEIFPPMDTNTFGESTYYADLIPEANLYPTSEANASEDPFDWNRFFQTPTPP